MKKLFFILILFSVTINAQDIAYVDSRYILENIPASAATIDIKSEDIN